jgi:hypothetical protein
MGTGTGCVAQFPQGNHIYRLWTLLGRIWNRKPNRGMSSGAAHHVGSQGVTVPNLMYPQPTFNLGQDEGGVLPLLQSQEI